MKGCKTIVEDKEKNAIHSYYLKILNLMPFIVYWVDDSCCIQGFNSKFGKLLKVFSKDDCPKDFHKKLVKSLGGSDAEANALKLDDMQVIFSGESQHDIPFASKKLQKNYLINREPLTNEVNETIGAVIVIMENQQISEKIVDKGSKKQQFKNNGTPKVLIVEDNTTAQQVESAIFHGLNCEVDAVTSAKEALKVFKPGKYNIVIMDIGLEDSSGYLLTKKFREIENGTGFHAVIIALTSYKPENVKDDCYYYDMQGVFAKPLTSPQAHEIIESFVYNNSDVDKSDPI